MKISSENRQKFSNWKNSIRYNLINFAEVEKQLGSWNNDGNCVAKGDDPTCGPGHQNQMRTCVDGTTDKCTASDTVQTISCYDEWKTIGINKRRPPIQGIHVMKCKDCKMHDVDNFKYDHI